MTHDIRVRMKGRRNGASPPSLPSTSSCWLRRPMGTEAEEEGGEWVRSRWGDKRNAIVICFA